MPLFKKDELPKQHEWIYELRTIGDLDQWAQTIRDNTRWYLSKSQTAAILDIPTAYFLEKALAQHREEFVFLTIGQTTYLERESVINFRINRVKKTLGFK